MVLAMRLAMRTDRATFSGQVLELWMPVKDPSQIEQTIIRSFESFECFEGFECLCVVLCCLI